MLERDQCQLTLLQFGNFTPLPLFATPEVRPTLTSNNMEIITVGGATFPFSI